MASKSCYFETLYSALTEAQARMNEDRIVLKDGDVWMADFQPMSYNERQQRSFEILTWKGGKPTRKWCHVIIYRLDSGRYELVNYVL